MKSKEAAAKAAGTIHTPVTKIRAFTPSRDGVWGLGCPAQTKNSAPTGRGRCQMDGKFTLEIDMGNDAMRSSKSLALALESVANKIRHGIKLPARGPGVTEEKILDGNGNTVGAWHYVEEK